MASSSGDIATFVWDLREDPVGSLMRVGCPAKLFDVAAGLDCFVEACAAGVRDIDSSG
jgi:hypothetical protein